MVEYVKCYRNKYVIRKTGKLKDTYIPIYKKIGDDMIRMICEKEAGNLCAMISTSLTTTELK